MDLRRLKAESIHMILISPALIAHHTTWQDVSKQEAPD